MNLSEAFNRIVNTRWTLSNNFKAHFQGEHGDLFNFLPEHGEINIVNFNLDALAAEEQNAYTGCKHVSILGVEEIHTCSMKIRDHNQLDIYKNFLKIWRSQIYKYYDEYKFSVVIIKEPDYPSESEKVVLTAKECYLFNVGNLVLDNEQENQIVEFDIQLKSPNISFDNIDQYIMLPSSIACAETSKEKSVSTEQTKTGKK